MALPPYRSGAEQALLLLLLLLPASGGVARAAPRSRVPAVFRDSMVDTGNNNQIPTPLRANFPPYGRDMPGGPRATDRFGNGRLPPDLISEALDLPPLVPAYLDLAYGIDDFARGVCGVLCVRRTCAFGRGRSPCHEEVRGYVFG